MDFKQQERAVKLLREAREQAATGAVYGTTPNRNVAAGPVGNVRVEFVSMPLWWWESVGAYLEEIGA